MKYVLVTGGAGFIGTNLCKLLLDRGFTVLAVDNFSTSRQRNYKYDIYKRFNMFKHDIVNPIPSSFFNKIPRLDYIFHLACPTGVPNIELLGEEMIRTCSEGTRNILELARVYNSKLLFTSSSEIYGDPKVTPQQEDYTGNVDPIGYRSPYEEGKRFSETIVKYYTNKYKVNAKIVRIFNTYGPFMSDNDTRVIPKFISSIKKNMPLTIQGKGLQKRTFCYVDDLIKGFILVMDKGKIGEVYNLGSDKETTILGVFNLLEKLLKNKLKKKYIRRPEHDPQKRLPSLRKTHALGWRQEINLSEGLSKTLKWYGL